MTKHRNRKQAVRAAMAATGDSYTRASRSHRSSAPPTDIVLGTDATGAPVEISERDLRRHIALFGATGSGWTAAVEHLAGQLLDRGWSGLVLDLTDSMGDWCREASAARKQHLRELRLHRAPGAPTVWLDPFAGLDPDGMRDVVMSVCAEADGSWRDRARALLTQLTWLLDAAHRLAPETFPVPSLETLGQVLARGDLAAATAPQRLAVLAGVPEFTDADFALLARTSLVDVEVAHAVAAKLSQLASSGPGCDLLRCPGGGIPPLDVAAAGVTYVGLDTMGAADRSQLVASAVLLQTVAHARRRITGSEPVGPGSPRFLIITPASEVDRDALAELVSRARSAQIVVVVCDQGPPGCEGRGVGDWWPVGRNVGTTIVMRQGTAPDADLAAQLLGPHADGELPREMPDLLRSLPTGQGYVGTVGQDPRQFTVPPRR